MADKVDLVHKAVFVLLTPALKKRLAVCSAVAEVIMLFGVSCTVINTSSRQLSVKLTGSIPVARKRADGGVPALNTLLPELRYQMAGCRSPIGKVLIDSLVLAPTEKAVHKDVGIALIDLTGFILRHNKAGNKIHKGHYQSDPKRNQRLIHNHTTPSFILIINYMVLFAFCQQK